MEDVQTFNLIFEEPFEFRPTMAEELLVKAMHSTRPLFLTDDFLARVASTKPESLVREMVADLHRDADPDDTAEMLRWYYLFMDFERDFPRMMMLAEIDAQRPDEPAVQAEVASEPREDRVVLGETQALYSEE